MIHYGSSFEGFVQLVGDRVRIFESEVRDLLSQVEGRSIVGLPSGSSVVPPGAVLSPPPKQVPAGEAGKAREAESPRIGGVNPPGVEPKAKPGVKFGAAEPQEFKEIAVKKEASEEEEKPAENTPSKEKKEKKERGEKKKKKRSRSRKRRKSSEERSRKEEKVHKKRRIEDSEADKEERKREKEDSPRRPEGKERKTREREEGPEAKEGGGSSSSAWRPEPSSGAVASSREQRFSPRPACTGWYQPRGERPQQGDKPPQGKGWQGRIPYSDHPRWSEGKNKGVTKRAKQERYHRRYR